MRLLLGFIGISLLGPLGLASMAAAIDAVPAAPPRCLQPERIRQTSIVDDSTILFQMRDGSVWVNHLVDRCPGLKLEGGFAYEVRGGEICGNLQSIRVLRGGPICLLGPFSPQP